jgi:hypothetical protein
MEMANPDGDGTVATPKKTTRVQHDAAILLDLTSKVLPSIGYHLHEASFEVEHDGDGQHMVALYFRIEPT